MLNLHDLNFRICKFWFNSIIIK